MTRKAMKNGPPMTFCQSDKLSNRSSSTASQVPQSTMTANPLTNIQLSQFPMRLFFLEFVAKLAGAKALAKPISKLSPIGEIRDFKTRSVADRLKKYNTLDCGTSVASTD